ncbi:MAG: cysteine desulfurase family protein [Burkholderiales bacterium]
MNSRTIYLDHQATTPVDTRVFSEMASYFSETFGNPHSVDHCFGWRAARAVDDAAANIAALVGADVDEIFFTSGATEANNLALLGLARRASKDKRRRILVSAIEHKSVLGVSQVLHEQLGFQVEALPVDASGFVAKTALAEMLSDDVLAVSIMAVNNEIGTIQDIVGLSEVVKTTDALFHCDAAQAPCAIDLRHASRAVDLLSLSSHKMYGPQGIGALFIRRDLQDRIEPLVYGGGQQRSLRSGTVPVALCVGMGTAATLINSSETAEKRVMLGQRRDAFVRKLMDLPWPIVLNGPKSMQRHPGNANVRFDGFDAHNILNALQPRLAASTGSACTSGILEPSHVLRAIGLSAPDAEASIRFSLGWETSDQDIDEAVGLINEILYRLGRADLVQSA